MQSEAQPFPFLRRTSHPRLSYVLFTSPLGTAMSSTMSLDSLSSPSPSPSPGPETTHAGPGAGLDSDSELSELTEEDQDTENTPHNYDRDEDDDDIKPRRIARHDTVATSRSDWGRRRKVDNKSANVVEEEEEEELSGPPKAMEEEEEEEDDEEDEPLPRAGSRRNENVFDEDVEDDSSSSSDDDDDEEEDRPAGPANEEESDSGERDRVVRNRRGARGQRAPTYQDRSHDYPSSSRKKKTFDSDDDEDDLSEPPAGQQDDGAESDNDDTNSEDGAVDDAAQNLKSPSVPISATSRNLKTATAATHADIDPDLTAPSPQSVGQSLAAAAASSIMGASTVLVPPSPSASSSASDMSSRSPTPTFEATAKGSKLDTENGPSSRRNSIRKASISDKQPEEPAAVNDDNNASAEVPEQDGSVGDIEVDEPSPDQDVEMELESDLQPAHRAEALDVLATIELKFALLRERVYVEKMECLAWEEALVGEGTHPELIHLLAELSKRRDKRLELASRKRAYEIVCVTKKRGLEENAVWSWWKVARDELQTDMISETNRKRRRLERERRATERPQPVRRIPKAPQDAPIPPTLRRIAKSFPQATAKQQSVHRKRDQSSANTVFPALSELSSADVTVDLNFLRQHRRTSLDAQRIGNVNVNGVNAHIGLPPPPLFHQFRYGAESTTIPPFSESGPESRMLPPPTPSFPNQHQHIPLATGQPPVSGYPSFSPGTGRHHHYSHPPSSSAVNLHTHNPPAPYLTEHEPPLVVPNAGSSSGHAHYPQPHHSYFNAAPSSIGPGSVDHGYPSQPGHLGLRRSISPVPVMLNGLGAQGGKNSAWPGPMHPNHKQSRSNEWMGNGRRHDIPVNDGEEDEREGMRIREMRREKERHREREREQHEYEQEHERERMHHMQQHPQHRHTLPGPPHQHSHPPPGPAPHHVPGPHHHHHHHHHVLHNHHSGSSAGVGHPSAPPPSGHTLALSPRIITSRDYEVGRSHSGPSSRPTEIINLSSKSTNSSNWKGDEFHPPRKLIGRSASGPPILDDRERTLAMPFVVNSHGASRDTGPPNGSTTVSSPRNSWNNADDPPYRIPQSSSAPSSYLGSADNHGHSPGQRYAHSASHLGLGPPPPHVQQNSIALSPPRSRPIPPSPSSSSTYVGPSRSPNRYGQSIHGPGPSPPHSHGSSMSTSPNMKTNRPGSPVLGGKLVLSPGSGFSPRPPIRTTTPAILSPPVDLKNGAVASTAAPYSMGSRTASPRMTYLSPVQHTNPALPPPPRPLLSSNGVGHPERHSPHLPPIAPSQKMTVAQMVEGL